MSTKNMFDRLSQTFMQQQFRRVDNVVWDLMSNTTGILTKDDAIATLTHDDSDAVNLGEGRKTKIDGSITINPLATMSMAIPAYGQRVAFNKINVGDITVDKNGEANGWITEIHNNGKFTVLKVDGNEQKVNPPTVNVMGFGEQSGLMVVKPLFELTGGNNDAIKNMLMPMMIMNDGNVNDSEMDKMMQMMLMTSAMGNGGMGGNNMMQTMMMMKMFGNGNF